MKFVLKLACCALLILPALPAQAQKFENLDRDRVRQILKDIAADVRKYYYDPKLHGFDFDGRVKEAQQRLEKAENLGQAFRIIAWTLEGLNDSHTYFIPPPRSNRTDYGWRMQMVGNHCYVTRVRPKSDAEAKGLKRGDEILSVNSIPATRENFETILYLYNILAPQPGLHLQLRGSDGQPHDLVAMANVKQSTRLVDLTTDGVIQNYIRESENAYHMTRTRCDSLGNELGICKMPEFNLDEDGVHSLLATARKHKGFILDLRDNGGGSVETLSQLIGGFFDHEVKIGDRVGRKPLKPQMAKPTHMFDGKLVVLVDSGSASAAELFARVMQLERRAIVIGDRSSGLVMEAEHRPYKIGTDSVVFYAASITEADIIMTDGNSLEHKGVVPDELLVPTAEDLRKWKRPCVSPCC